MPSIPRLLRWEPADTATASALYEVFRAAHLADEPVEPPESPRTHRSLLAGKWEGAAGEVWYLPDDAGEARGSIETGGAGESSGTGAAVAYYRLDLPDLENTDRAFVGLYVHPAVRRRGLGRALLRHAAQRATANGRATLDGVALEDSAGEAFARSVGATMGLEKARQVQELRAVPPERVAELHAEAERAAAGYSLMTWNGPVPDESAARFADVVNAFADSPHAEGVQPEVWDADRIRQRWGRLLREGHLRGYSIAALREGAGEMAALTEVTIDPQVPQWGRQRLTAVTRPHRGHRLGLLVKTAMMQWLAKAEPQLERIETGNTVANDHMIA
ncbi:MAG: GNAT family N-acetyltransferase, partial [Trebonia sp.]